MSGSVKGDFVEEIPPPKREAAPKYVPVLLEVQQRKIRGDEAASYKAVLDTHGKASARRRGLQRAAKYLAESADHPEIGPESFSIVTRYNTRAKNKTYSVFAEYRDRSTSDE